MELRSTGRRPLKTQGALNASPTTLPTAPTPLNAFLGGACFRGRTSYKNSQTFQCLENYRNLLHKVQAIADFMFDVSQELHFNFLWTMLAGREGETADQEIV